MQLISIIVIYLALGCAALNNKPNIQKQVYVLSFLLPNENL